MLNNWDDPFAKFADNNNNTANATNQTSQASNDVIEQSVNKKIIEQAETAEMVTPQTAVENTAAQQPDTIRAPHAGDGIVSNEQLMATAGAAPQVSPILEDIPQQLDSEADTDLTGTGLEEIQGEALQRYRTPVVIESDAGRGSLVEMRHRRHWRRSCTANCSLQCIAVFWCLDMPYGHRATCCA